MTVALAIHPGALGDVLLAVPALRALAAGGVKVTLAAQPRIGALLTTLGVVTRAVAFDTLGFDVLFTDAPLPPEAPLARLLAESGRVVCWFGARDGHFTRRLRALAPGAVIAPPSEPPTLVWQHLLRTVGAGAVRAPLVVPPARVDDGRRALTDAGWDGRGRIVVLHPGAGGTAKRWPVDGFVDVAQELDAAVVVHQGPADADAVQGVLARARRPLLRLVEPALPVLAGALVLATAYLGNDSGVSHLAAAVGAPSIVLYTEAALPWAPWSSTARCLTVTTTVLVDAERAGVRAALGALL